MKIILLIIPFAISFFLPSSQAQELPVPLQKPVDTSHLLLQIHNAALLERTNPDSSIALLKPLLQRCSDVGFNRGICSALVHIGMAQMAMGEANSAFYSYKEAEKQVQHSCYDKDLVACLYTGIGTPYLKKGDYAQASFYYYKALDVITKNNLQLSGVAAHLYQNLCNLWWHLRRYDNAMRYIRQSEKIAIGIRDTTELIFIYGNMSTLYYSRNNLKSSDEYALLALKLAEQKQVIRAQQLILANMGATLWEQGNATAAIPCFQRSMSLADDAHSYQHNLQSYYNLAFAYYQTGDYKKAKHYALYAIRKSEEYNMDKEHIGQAMKTMADIYKKEGNIKEENKWLSNYTDYIENTLEKEADSSINRLENDFRIVEKDKQIAQKQLLLSKLELKIKNKNIWIGGISGGILLLVMSLFLVIRTYRHKHSMNNMQIHSLQQGKELMYLKAIMEGEEKERIRLARELHDGIGGMLTSAKMNLGSIKQRNAQLTNINALDDVIRLLDDTATEIRQTAHNLMPDALTNNSLKDALILYCTDINISGQLEIDVQFHGQLEKMNKPTELIFYRITQELIQNIIKHSQATQVVIQIIQDDGRLNLIVEDNGVGFDPAEIEKGFGLQNLRFRVQALQGYISVNSAKEMGTSVYVEFDLEKLKNV